LRNSAGFWGSVVLLTGLGYVFPGHTYLQQDTQIYVPMMERIYNPVLFLNDPMITRPYLALTAYDEIAIALRNYAGLNFERGLKLQQLVFRACAAAALLLIALRLGLGLPGAFFIAGAVILNAVGFGGVTELEPVARSFALALLLLAVGLATGERYLAAGTAAASGFLIHPTTMAPFYGVAAFVVLRRAARPILLAPLLPAVVVFFLLMHFQTGGTEPIDFFRRLDPFQEALQRKFMLFNFVSEWTRKMVGDCLLQGALVGAGFWRLRDRLQPPLREWLWGFAAIAVLSIPFSWIVLDQLHWAMAAPWEPTRALLYITLLAILLSAACGIVAAQKKRWWEAPVWFTVALALPVKDSLATWFVDARLIVLVLALAGACTVLGWFAGRTRGLSLVAAGILPFIAFPMSGLVAPPPPVDPPELRQLAAWAKTTTDESAVFLFADEGSNGGTGPFRAQALRSIYVDYEGRALVNYFPAFTAEWARRWRDVREGHWLVGPQDFQELSEKGIDFVVLQKKHALPTKQPEFSNSHYVVYRVIGAF
jgi:hypothetical protein